VAKLPSLQKWLQEKGESIQMIIEGVEGGGAYSRSIVIMHDVIKALEEVEGAPKFFSSDFCHQYTQYGGYGNIWGLVTADPDSIKYFYSILFLKSIK
jgi:hypothetical protein